MKKTQKLRIPMYFIYLTSILLMGFWLFHFGLHNAVVDVFTHLASNDLIFIINIQNVVL